MAAIVMPAIETDLRAAPSLACNRAAGASMPDQPPAGSVKTSSVDGSAAAVTIVFVPAATGAPLSARHAAGVNGPLNPPGPAVNTGVPHAANEGPGV
jgi:hypothetical protein